MDIASIVFDETLHVLHATPALSGLLCLLPEMPTDGHHIMALLGSSTALDSDSLVLFSQFVRDSERQTPFLLSSLDGKRAIKAEICRLDDGCRMATFEDVTAR